MDYPRQQYLLHRKSQIDQYRSQYAGFIEKYSEQYRRWFQSLPMWEWVPLPYMTDKMAKAVIGLLCILYIDGLINLTVNKEVTQVLRGPLTEDDYKPKINENTLNNTEDGKKNTESKGEKHA